MNKLTYLLLASTSVVALCLGTETAANADSTYSPGAPSPNGTLTFPSSATLTDYTYAQPGISTGGGGIKIEGVVGTVTATGVTINQTGRGGSTGNEAPAALSIRNTSSTANPGINVQFAGAGSNLSSTNTTIGDSALSVYDASGPINIDVSQTTSGNVFTTAKGSGINAQVIGTYAINITTGAADQLLSAGVGTGFGITTTGPNSNVTNNGIIGNTSGPNSLYAGVEYATSVTNNGTITADTYGIFGSGTLIVVNTGSISALSGRGIEDGGAYGGPSSIINGKADGSSAATISSNSYGITFGNNGTITNYAGATISGTTLAINFSATDTLNNYGTISGGIIAENGSAVTMNLYAGSVTGNYNDSSSTVSSSISLYTATPTLAAASFGTFNLVALSQFTLRGAGDGSTANGAMGTLDLSKVNGYASITKADSGTWLLTLTGTSTNRYPLTVNGGTLLVNALIGTSNAAVNAGGTLGGTGTVGATTVTGGTLAPGAGNVGTMNIASTLSLDSNSVYAVHVTPGSASSVIVTGAASIAGTLSATYAGGVYTNGQYTVLTAAGGISGTFDTLTASAGLPAGYAASLSYDANDVYLNLTGLTTGFFWKAAPASGDWNTAANWQGGAVPGATDTAEFGATSIAAVTIGQATSAGNLEIDAGAPAYSFAITGSGAGAASLTLSNGITDQSSNAPILTASGVSGDTGTLAFTGTGTAADAKLTAGNFGMVSFSGNTDAGDNAAVTALSGGTVDFSATTGTAANNQVTAGSIAGAGNFVLGANVLTVGALNTSTEVSGVISGTGGALVKSGSGILVLSGTNTYTGGTTVTGGALQIGNGGTTGAIVGDVTDNSALAFDHADTLTFSGAVLGTGSLSQIGAGTLILTGTNTYAGTTSIIGGTLQLGNGGTTGSLGGGTVLDNGTLAVNRSDAVTLNQNILGTGNLYKQGSGTLTLTATNNYTGTTTVSAGTLQVGNGGATGTLGTGPIVDNSTLTFDRSGSLTVAGAVSGSGAIVQAGSGTTILAANNSYLSATTISAGTLQVGNSGTTGSLGSAAVTDNGTLAFNRTNTITVANAIAGSGGLSQAGSGITILTANNSYSGTTTIGAGTLQIGNGAPSGTTGTGAIVDNGLLAFARGAPPGGADDDKLTVPNVISGTGGVELDEKFFTQVLVEPTPGHATVIVDHLGGDVTTVLTAAETYTGATKVNGGALALQGAGSIAASSGLTMTDAGTFDISQIAGAGTSIKSLDGSGVIRLGNRILTITQGNGTFAGTIADTGAVDIRGSGETLTGYNIYTGGTILDVGATLTVKDGGSLGIGGILFLPNTTLRFLSGGTFTNAATFATGAPIYDTNGSTITWSGLMSGPGDLGVTGGGTLILANAANTYAGGTEIYGNAALRIDADSELGAAAPLQLGDASSNGTLQLASSFNLDPTRAITVNAGGGTVDTQGYNSTISQAIGGAGGLTKAGSGVLTLAGANTYAGPTTVNAGTLLVTGSTGSGAVTVNSGGTLGGTGQVGATTIAAGGKIAPGINNIGVLHTGALTLASGSVTAIDLTPSASDQIVVSGAANLGGTLALTPGAGTYAAGTDYKLITATSVSGTFSSVTGASALGLISNVRYSATGADLVLNYPFTNYASTLNQTAVAKVLNASPAGSGTANALGNVVASNPAAVPGALSQLAGDIHASLRSAAIEGDRIIRDSVLTRLGQAAEDHLAIWATGFGGYGSIRTDGNAAGVHQNTAGFMAGADMPLGDGFRIGAAGAYTTQNVNVAANVSRASGNTGHLVAYGNWSGGPFDLSLGGDYGWGTNQVTRQITALAETDRDHQSQRIGQVFGDAGYKIVSDAATVEPYVDIAHFSVTTGGFAETGGPSALSGGSKTDGETYSTLGIRAALINFELEGFALTPRIDLGWQHSFDTLRPGQTVELAATGQSFNVLGVPLAVDAAAVKLGVDMTVAPNASISIGYDGSFSSRVQDNGIEGSFSLKL